MTLGAFEVAVPKEIEVTLGRGVEGTLALPHSLDLDEPYEIGFAPATHKVALILHGQAGHRDYCYQRHLAHRLAADLGIYSLRIDFRGCGSSADNEDPKKGRIIEQDMEDIQACAEFLTDGKKNPLGINFTLSSIIGHSRGGVAMFLWALQQDQLLKSEDSASAIIVPNLINCSSRYRSYTIASRYPIFDDKFESLPITSFRNGKYQPLCLMKEELVSLSLPDLSKLRELSLGTSVLSVYGLQDTIIPVDDCASYANTLNRGYDSHRLELIPDADHNFFGVHPIENKEDAERYNPNHLPINSKKLVNYNYSAARLIIDYLKPENELKRFMEYSNNIGTYSRWKKVDGVSNFRDLGGWRITSPTFQISKKDKYYVKPNVAFRCANIANITPKGLQALQNLNIKAIFDLRSDGECISDGFPRDLEKYGIKRIHSPVFTNDDYSPQAIAMRYTNLMTSWFTYVNVYENMLELGSGAFRVVFEYIRDEGKPFVFHCTAGKDRTGILGMLILMLLGVDKHTIAKEYELTTIGLKPDHEEIRSKFMNTIAKLKAKMERTSDIEQLIVRGRKNWTIEKDGFNNLISSRYEAMLATIELFNDKYNGIIDYMKEVLKFSENDLTRIYNNLVVIDKQGGLEINSFVNWENRNKAKI